MKKKKVTKKHPEGTGRWEVTRKEIRSLKKRVAEIEIWIATHTDWKGALKGKK